MAGSSSPQSLATERSTSRAYRIITVSFTIFCQGFQALAFGGIALFLPMIRADLGLSYTQAGILSSLLWRHSPTRSCKSPRAFL